jgi:steroid 5-alpha reductase family enzyme
MTDLFPMLTAIPYLVGLSVIAWLISLKTMNAAVVDAFWPLFIAAATLTYALEAPRITSTTWLVLALVGLWAVRLLLHVTIRSWQEIEDRRYAEIRARWGDKFALKSLLGIFGLQVTLAWLISSSLLVATSPTANLTFVHVIAASIWLFGLTFETVADIQLRRFKVSNNRNSVLDTGLWRYSRHPNYFGECCVWWSAYLLALPSGGWWTILSPLIMTYCLLHFTGIHRMETGISQRRPDYARYIRRTSKFIPLPPRK